MGMINKYDCMMEQNYLDRHIRKIPDFPKPGILFYDVTTLFEDAAAFKLVIDEMFERYAERKIDKVVGIDARGFLLASALAYRLGAGVAVARKKGKLPFKTIGASYEKEYGPDVIEMHEDAIKPGETVIIVDDLLATGGTMMATVELVERLGGTIVGIEFLVKLGFLSGWAKLNNKGYRANFLLEYNSEKTTPASQTASTIKVGIIGGSGLDNPDLLSEFEEVSLETPFGATSAPLITGKLNGVSVVILARHGRRHELTPAQVPYRANLWALKEVGCTHILATTACGSLRENIRPGDLVLADQFIDQTRNRHLTIYENQVVHTPMADPFCDKLRSVLSQTAEELGLICHGRGSVITTEGQRFSTRAESNLFRLWGADIINMSTVPEVIMARELGICYQAIAIVTDYDSWRIDEEAVTWEMIKAAMVVNADRAKKLIVAALPKINIADCVCRRAS